MVQYLIGALSAVAITVGAWFGFGDIPLTPEQNIVRTVPESNAPPPPFDQIFDISLMQPENVAAALGPAHVPFVSQDTPNTSYEEADGRFATSTEVQTVGTTSEESDTGVAE